MKHVVVGILYRNVNNTNLYLLMSSTADFGKFTGLLYPAGGHLEEGEIVRDALVREIFEELGIRIEPIQELFKGVGDVPDQITHWWICNPLPPDINITVDKNEVKEIKWLTKEEIINSPNLMWPATYKFFTDILFKRE